VSRLAGEPVSGLNPQTRKPANPQTVFILDTIGRLRDFYSIADIVFVGGSLVRHGGQNPIEPAYFSKPVIFGPSMFNFDQMSQILLKAGAAVQIEDRTQLKNILAELIRQPARRRQMGASAKAATEQNKGASLKNIELIRGFL
jgi:3-deoxy-D-manno-octulosonic-acid transferase